MIIPVLVATPGTGARADDQEAEQAIAAFDATLLSVMKNADKLGYEGRYKALEPVIRKTFNIPLMTHIVTGSFWNDWTDQQHEQVSQAFEKFITATYARRFDGYSGEQFIIDGQRPSNGGALVMTHITRRNDPPVALNYVTREMPGEPYRVVDVFLTGTISELATRRSEFGAILQRDGFKGLMAALEAKANAQANP